MSQIVRESALKR